MKKQFLIILGLLTANFFLLSSCDKNDNDPQKTKTELLTQGSWKFKSASANGTDVSNQAPPFDACRKDNILTFSANGTGTVNEGTTSCSPAENTTFNWNFANSETTVHVSTALYPGTGNDFTLVSISDNEMVLSIGYSPIAGPTILILITFMH